MSSSKSNNSTPEETHRGLFVWWKFINSKKVCRELWMMSRDGSMIVDFDKSSESTSRWYDRNHSRRWSGWILNGRKKKRCANGTVLDAHCGMYNFNWKKQKKSGQQPGFWSCDKLIATWRTRQQNWNHRPARWNCCGWSNNGRFLSLSLRLFFSHSALRCSEAQNNKR